TRITAACRMRGTRFSYFMTGLKYAGVKLNRKMLSQIAIEDPTAFDRLVSLAAKHASATAAAD
ncbi:MAG: 50S ribosomal protein L20, partial [Phycisphaerales bacterium]|nr:50S ribosomal protein L20 [Phycisphaerales bacterium]